MSVRQWDRCAEGIHVFGERATCLCGQQLSATDRAEGREGMVTVYDQFGYYVGCIGVETWQKLLADGAAKSHSRESQ